MRRIALAVPILLTACVSQAACDDYVEYICACRADEYDCNQVRLENQNPDDDQLADCQIELNRLQDEDEAADEACEP